jgi:colanic acid biosynthesis glycosyl transferase WcaI
MLGLNLANRLYFILSPLHWMKNRILLIGYNYYPEPTGIGKYSGEMVYWLAQHGYDCTVLTTYPYYPYWRVQEPYTHKKRWYSTEVQNFTSGGRITVHRCPMYVPAKPSGLKRILLDFSFLISAFLRLLLLRGQYDYVVAVAPSFLFGLLGVLCKKLKNSKFIYHIQDLQIEAANELGIIKLKAAIALLFKLEKYIINQADVVSSISEGMMQRIQEKSFHPVILFPNWANTADFYPIMHKEQLKETFGFPSTSKILLYSGAIGEKQGLEAILYTAKELQADEDVLFLICGSGPYKNNLVALSERLGLRNVIFFPLQPLDKFNAFLNLADVHLVIQKANASDLVMPSKLTTILAVGGISIITANPGSSLYSLVAKYKIGLLVRAENQQALTEGIRQAIATPAIDVAQQARIYAERYLSIESVMTNFQQHVLN